MSDDSLRSIEMTRLEKGRYEATNPRGGRLAVGQGGTDETFTPVELLLVAIAGCGAIDVDLITAKRSEPTRFDVRVHGDKIRDEQGNRMTNLVLSFDVEFPDDEAGRAAYDVLPRAVQQSHDRLCTVSRTVELGTPVESRIG
ncbi:OsmC family protein [Nocardioides panacis]|uniref:OsmC family protein n=1 Tax=Nocardioides panacis TaxID=2849501 RepID=A0A975T2I0_9ACTN|nr:OsmC family protein [Nocardioides panacis]QWZ09810.1 OsmC family protein [Nocardioides panacis]